MQSRHVGIWSLVVCLSCPAYAAPGSYDVLVRRYERQIEQQQRQLESLRSRLAENEREADQWQRKAEISKKQWKATGALLEKAQTTLTSVREQWKKTRLLVQTAQWAVAEKSHIRESAQREMRILTTALYKDRTVQTATREQEVELRPLPIVLSQLTDLSLAAQLGFQEARRQEQRWRQEEAQWRRQEVRYRKASSDFQAEQHSHWSRWQQALKRKQHLEDERNQMEQSAQALRVILEELRTHRDQARDVIKEERRVGKAVMAPRVVPMAKASLPWPVRGHVVQTFGRHYSQDLHQLQISNGIKIQGEAGKSVRCIEPGKVLYARPFQRYGQLVIVQHAKQMTSVYGSLGQTQVQEGQLLTALDPIGTLDATGAFYFEMRHQEEPIDPLVWLAPNSDSNSPVRRTSP